MGRSDDFTGLSIANLWDIFRTKLGWPELRTVRVVNALLLDTHCGPALGWQLSARFLIQSSEHLHEEGGIEACCLEDKNGEAQRG